MLPAGRLNQRVTLQSPGGSRDAYGERTTTWTDVAAVWAALEPMSQREITAGGQEQAGATWRVIVRERPELDAMAADWRVKLGDRVYVLVAPPVPLMQRGVKEAGYLELRCTEGLRTE
jgi:SPP1 family predicted phage head-tail adaptor